MTKKPVVSPAVEKAFYETWDDGTTWEGALAAIAQDRLERPFREEGPAQEAPCANAFYEQQKAAASAEEYERVHNAERNRAYIAIDVLRLENPLGHNTTIHEAAREVLLSFFGYEVEKEEEEESADLSDIPVRVAVPGLNSKFEDKTRGGFPVSNFYKSSDPDDDRLHGTIVADFGAVSLSWNAGGSWMKDGTEHPYDLIHRIEAAAPPVEAEDVEGGREHAQR